MLPHEREHRRERGRRGAARRVRRDRARRRIDQAARSAGAGTRAARHPFRDGISDAAEPPQRGRAIPGDEFITAKDKHVIIIGGGDTGADCLGTAHRQGAKSVHQLELLSASARRPRRRQSLAALAEYLSRLVGARRRRRAALLDRDAEIHAARTVASPRCTESRRDGEHGRSRRIQAGTGKRRRAGGRSRAAGDGIPRPGEDGMLDKLGVKMTNRGNVWRDAALDDKRARRLHGRRHAARPVAHRLGDRRRPILRARRR